VSNDEVAEERKEEKMRMRKRLAVRLTRTNILILIQQQNKMLTCIPLQVHLFIWSVSRDQQTAPKLRVGLTHVMYWQSPTVRI